MHSWNECLENGNNPCAGPTSVEFFTFWDREILNLSEFVCSQRATAPPSSIRIRQVQVGMEPPLPNPTGEFPGDQGCSTFG